MVLITAPPTLEQDMKNHPEKMREDVQDARRLWETGLLEIRGEEGEHELTNRCFVPRALICAASRRISELCPDERSWHILEFETIPVSVQLELSLWDGIDGFLTHLSTGSAEFMSTGYEFVFNWNVGATLACPKYQNAATIQFCMSDRALEHQSDKDRTSVLKGSRSLVVFSYMVDKLVWEAGQGGESWLATVHDGGYFAIAIAKAMVDTAKESTPPGAPRFPPWHPSNRQKYLVDENPKPAHSGESDTSHVIVKKEKENPDYSQAAPSKKRKNTA